MTDVLTAYLNAFTAAPQKFHLFTLPVAGSFVTLRVDDSKGPFTIQRIEADAGFLSLHSIQLHGLVCGYIFAPQARSIEVFVEEGMVRFFRPGARNKKFVKTRCVMQNADFVLQGSADNAYLLVGKPSTSLYDARFSHSAQDFDS